MAHVLGMPLQLAAARQQLVANSTVLMNHWRLVMISSGRSPFS
jgi:hypothetical protein